MIKALNNFIFKSNNKHNIIIQTNKHDSTILSRCNLLEKIKYFKKGITNDKNTG